MVPKGMTHSPAGTQKATGEEQRPDTSNCGNCDAPGGNPPGSPGVNAASGEQNSLSFKKTLKIATWNLRSMNQGKSDIVKKEMDRLQIDILGVTELRWTGSSHFQSDDFTVYYSGHDNIRKNGVAFIAQKNTVLAVESYKITSERIMSICLHGKPMNITILLVYAPTTDASEEELERFYSEVQKAVDETPKKDVTYILGDFDVKVGKQAEANIVGSFGLGKRNESGEHLIQLCQENRLRLTNIWFMQPKRRLYTWTSPYGLNQNQIDYVLCSQQWRSSVVAVKTFPGAHCGSDHELLVAKIQVRLCGIKKHTPPKKFDISKIPASYTIEVKKSLLIT
ncbi:LOW QUALITY PROTEIN: craniofacial development protein 2-like [Erpetoichthys calabaricus]|uniref:LOW QUALITY PROTEIN: craniofacial development protein 2-like n=1 Tax=Erpetoichthys calabaricus TaxID=27687 RepID=UPI002234AA48|nr:LOW QUALITY PROTEIN: craniofacial development protein 2-like [Erpetoichthys calabaricus]